MSGVTVVCSECDGTGLALDAKDVRMNLLVYGEAIGPPCDLCDGTGEAQESRDPR